MQTFEAWFIKHECSLHGENRNLQPNPAYVPGPGPPTTSSPQFHAHPRSLSKSSTLWLTRIQWSIHPSLDELRTNELIKETSLSQQGRSIPYYCFHEKNHRKKGEARNCFWRTVLWNWRTWRQIWSAPTSKRSDGEERCVTSPVRPVLVGRGCGLRPWQWHKLDNFLIVVKPSLQTRTGEEWEMWVEGIY